MQDVRPQFAISARRGELERMDSFMANTAAAVTALILMLAAVITWQNALGSKRENALIMTGIVLMGLGASAAFMVGRF